MAMRLFLAAQLLNALVAAQQPYEYTPEVHPQLITSKCTVAGGCVEQNTSVVLDAGYRWIHEIGGYTNCVTSAGVFNSTICPNATACGQNCAMEGADYPSYGILSSGSTITLEMFVNGNGASPRCYLLDDTGFNYESIKLNGREFTFDVDVSQLPCGMNGALYMTAMDPSGGRNNVTNPAGAAYGTGVCDSQCGKGLWFNGEANFDNLGACCSEMDFWEANSKATALTPHLCNVTGIYGCTGDACGFDGVCDEYGCGWNPYGQGATSFYGPGETVDTTKPFTVVTQFITQNGSPCGTLIEIRRLYVQDGVVTGNPVSTVANSDANNATNAITDGFCNAGYGAGFEERGGLKPFGAQLAAGMTLLFSIWDDGSQFMNWLDSGSSGPCNSTEGNPSFIQANYPKSQVTWSNIKWGEINSTWSAN